MTKILLISNMYPGNEKDQDRGVFVKNFISSIQEVDNSISFSKIVIKGRKYGIDQIIAYLIFYLKIIYRSIFCKYDLIYVHFITYSSLPLLFLLPFKRFKLILNIHGSDFIVKSNVDRLILNLIKPLIKHSSLIVVPSNIYKNQVSKKFNLLPDKIFVYASGGINTSIFFPQNTNLNEEFVVGMVSRISPQKGWDIFLEAMRQLKEESIIFRTIVVGGGAEENDFVKLKEKYELKNIEFKGFKPQKELPYYFNQMSVMIFPTLRLQESLGLVGLEAMSCGVPVIGSRIGGLQDYLSERYNGFLFEPGNYKQLAQKIKDFYHLDVEKKKEIQKNAISTAKKYDSYHVTKQLIASVNKITK